MFLFIPLFLTNTIFIVFSLSNFEPATFPRLVGVGVVCRKKRTCRVRKTQKAHGRWKWRQLLLLVRRMAKANIRQKDDLLCLRNEVQR